MVSFLCHTYIPPEYFVVQRGKGRGGDTRYKPVRYKEAGRGGGGWRGCTQFVHGRRSMTIDPRIHTMPGRSTSGFQQPGRHCLHQARSVVRFSASRVKGEMHASKNRARKTDFGILRLLSCLWVTAPMSWRGGGIFAWSLRPTAVS